MEKKFSWLSTKMKTIVQLRLWSSPIDLLYLAFIIPHICLLNM